MSEEGLVFDLIAEDYDRVRPGYPPAIIDAACSKAELSDGSRVVEVGCGTGKLTEDLVARRLQVEAIDPGPELVQLARRRLRDSTVGFHLGRFEDVHLQESAFEARLLGDRLPLGGPGGWVVKGRATTAATWRPSSLRLCGRLGYESDRGRLRV